MKIIITIGTCLISLAAYSQKSATYTALDSLTMEKNPAVREQMLTKLKKNYPDKDFGQEYARLVTDFSTAKDQSKALEYFGQLKGANRSKILSKVANALISQDVKKADIFINQELAVASNTPEDTRTLQYAQIQLLKKKEEFGKAYEKMKPYYGQSQFKNPNLTSQYYYLMSKSGDYKTAFPELEKAVLEGTTDEIRNELMSVYTKLNPDKNVKTYVTSLDDSRTKAAEAKAKEKMVTEKAPAFTVTDLNGKAVSLSDFAGKTVVIDFWATWCGPCVASLPAMQAAVNKYKSNPNVVFLFIHTWEKVPNPTEDAKSFFFANGYNLPLYMDLRDLATKKCPAVSAFRVTGIPAKFIIDGKGDIRFKATGFGGTIQAATDDLTAMIELALKSN